MPENERDSNSELSKGQSSQEDSDPEADKSSNTVVLASVMTMPTETVWIKRVSAKSLNEMYKMFNNGWEYI